MAQVQACVNVKPIIGLKPFSLKKWFEDSEQSDESIDFFFCASKNTF